MINKKIKEKKSISQLEGWSWNIEIPSEDNSSYEEYNFYVLHNKPLRDYTIEDMYFMIGQESGLTYFIPIAIEILSKDLFIKAEDYPGDLLKRVLFTDKPFWTQYPKEYKKLTKIVEKNSSIYNPNVSDEINQIIKEGLVNFSNHKP